MSTVIDSFTGRWAFLSNFWSVVISYEGLEYPSVEHAYQAAKSRPNDIAMRYKFAVQNSDVKELTAGQAKSLGQKIELRSDWERVKEQVMYDCVKNKFAYNIELREALFSTEDRTLIEGNTWHDTYWGVCNGKGENRLGQILMRVRKELRESFTDVIDENS